MKEKAKMLCSSFLKAAAAAPHPAPHASPNEASAVSSRANVKNIFSRATSQEQRDRFSCEQRQEQRDELTLKNKVKCRHQDVAKTGHFQLRSRLKTLSTSFSILRRKNNRLDYCALTICLFPSVALCLSWPPVSLLVSWLPRC